ncbi:zinc finger protein ZAT1-like protein [Tanacetum coccineum]
MAWAGMNGARLNDAKAGVERRSKTRRRSLAWGFGSTAPLALSGCLSVRLSEQEEEAAAMGLMMLPNGFANSGGDEMVFGLGEDFDHKRAHCNVIKSSKNHRCPICFKEFGSGPSLGGHMSVHSIAKKTSKDYKCSKIFGSGEDLEDHKRVSCNVIRNSEVHKCKICFKEFGSGPSLGGKDLEDHNFTREPVAKGIINVCMALYTIQWAHYQIKFQPMKMKFSPILWEWLKRAIYSLWRIVLADPIHVAMDSLMEEGRQDVAAGRNVRLASESEEFNQQEFQSDEFDQSSIRSPQY